MDGFLPLIEAFLAFALTMMGLATAVAALTGIWQRVLRWRGAILRESLVTLYAGKLAPMLKQRTGSTADDESLAEFVVEMTMLPVAYHEALPTAAEQANGTAADGQAPKSGLRDPLQATHDLRERRITRVRRALGVPEGRSVIMRQLFRFKRAWHGWLASRYAIESLPEDQFARRLADASAGQRLAAGLSATQWDAMLQDITQTYTSIGAGATEEFTRRCRVYTVALSFALVFGVNVDAFNLLNRYLTDPAIRAQVIERQQTLLAEAEGSPAEVVLPAVDRLQTKTDELAEQLQQLTASLPDVEGVNADLDEALEGIRQLQSDLTQEAQEVAAAGDALASGFEASRTIATDLVDNFPIGWNRYPYCDARVSTDPRCLAVIESGPRQPRATSQNWLTGQVDSLINRVVSERLMTFFGALDDTWQADAGGMLKWFLGVLLAGLMAGLGAPFWVRVVNRVLEARNAVRARGGQSAGAGSDTGEPGPASPRPASLLTTAASPSPEDGAATAHRAADEALAKTSTATP